MKVLSIINLKGGVAKTISSVNMAHILATVHGFKVLLIDNDKQGNASKAFGLYDPEDHDNVARVMLEAVPLIDLAASTQYKNLDIVPANMDLLEANLRVIADVSRPQQTRIKKAISKKSIERELQGEETTSAAEEYDFIIFDNAPDVNMSIINALVVSDDVIVPVEIDQYSFDGLDILLEQIAAVKEDFNPALSFRGCLITKYRQREEVQAQGAEVLKERCNVFSTKIRRTEDKPKESTFAKIPLVEYSVRCGASQDYKKFVTEYLEMIGEASKCN